MILLIPRLFLALIYKIAIVTGGCLMVIAAACSLAESYLRNKP